MSSKAFLPKRVENPFAPPIKCQGIKTKLVSFIAQNISWDGNGKWIEPFLGSGVVLFNVAPKRALVADTNKHIIKFYLDIQNRKIDEKIVREYLVENGALLSEGGVDYYYKVRERFNTKGLSLDFLFLNRSCFNGLIRFNSRGQFNVPFGHKPNRFSKAYITKIVNQVSKTRSIIHSSDWEFRASSWQHTLNESRPQDFVYLDPPYIGRHTDYFNDWSDREAIALAESAKDLPCGFALSMWKENRYRKNDHLERHWQNVILRTFDHFYHLGSTENLRNKMIEALAITPHSTNTTKLQKRASLQPTLL